ncbi:MAG: leucine-rich repeat domain-containing protein [Bacteroidota bacterium]
MKGKFVLFCFLLSFQTSTFSQDKNGFYSLEEANQIHPDSVFKLSLKRQKLDSLPKEILKFKNITHLDLSFNKLSSLPDFLSEFKLLQEIDISKNKFTLFPTQLCLFPNLEHLKMNRNEIAKIDECIVFLSSLSYIDFWDNPIKEFPTAFLDLKNLKEIHAEGIRYNPKFQEKWFKALPKVKIFFDAPCDCVD